MTADQWDVPSSFTDFLHRHRPELLPKIEAVPGTVTHATTILALRYADGIVMAGDRQATAGYQIESRDIEKVFPVDNHSAMAISGVAGPAVEMVRLFATELEFYEKFQGAALTLEGRANFLSRLIRGNFAAAMQGLVVLPIYAGYDLRRHTGRIFRFDVTGGRWDETDYHSQGSGGIFARGTLKKSWTEGLDGAAAVKLAIEAIADAGDEDAATAGPDPAKGIYPTVFTITAEGVRRVADELVHSATAEVLS